MLKQLTHAIEQLGSDSRTQVDLACDSAHAGKSDGQMNFGSAIAREVGVASISLGERLLIGVALAAGLAYLTTPLAIAAAERLAFTPAVGLQGSQAPDAISRRRGGDVRVRVGGGDRRRGPNRTLPLLAGVAVLLVIGTIDDRRTVTPQLRVAASSLSGCC